MFSEYIGDGAPPDLMPEVGECALNSPVSPRWVFERHAQNEIDNRFHDSGPAWTPSMAIVPLGRHQLPVPPQQRIRGDQGLQLVQYFASERLGSSGQSTALGVREVNPPPAQALSENTVLFLQVFDHIQLMPVDPTDEHHEQNFERYKRGGHRMIIYPTRFNFWTLRVGSAPADLMMSRAAAQPPLIYRTNTRLQPLSLLSDLHLTEESIPDC